MSPVALLKAITPIVDLLLSLVLRIAILRLDLAFKLFAVSIDLRNFVVSKLPPLLFGFARELLPVSFYPIPVHRRLLVRLAKLAGGLSPRRANACTKVLFRDVNLTLLTRVRNFIGALQLYLQATPFVMACMINCRPIPRLLTALTVIALAGSSAAQGQAPGKIDLEVAELQAGHLIGWPVIAGGDEVGVISDVSIAPDGKIDKIRVRTGFRLGFGERMVEIPTPAFTVLRDAVVLDLTAEEVDAFPDAFDLASHSEAERK
jgi:hypothetical protein